MLEQVLDQLEKRSSTTFSDKMDWHLSRVQVLTVQALFVLTLTLIPHSSHGTKPIMPVGRDVSGAESALTSGLMTGKRLVENNDAAFDMKSLGKHIEAVSHTPFRYLVQSHVLVR
jgi:hypothetical protein